jgi:RNA polymerase sigma factor (sigma-70 family)
MQSKESFDTAGFAKLPAMPNKPAGKTRPPAQPHAIDAANRPNRKTKSAGTAAPETVTAATARRRVQTPDADPLVALFKRILCQDQKALATLYEMTIGRVYGLALRISRNEAAAEEIAEDVYLQVWKSAASYSQERGHPLAWMMVITRSRALDYLRRADIAESHPEPETLANYAETDDDPQDLLLALQSGKALHAAVAKLPAVQRQLLALAFFQGLSHSEIAVHAHLPLGTVKTHLRQALLALRAKLAD